MFESILFVPSKVKKNLFAFFVAESFGCCAVVVCVAFNPDRVWSNKLEMALVEELNCNSSFVPRSTE